VTGIGVKEKHMKKKIIIIVLVAAVAGVVVWKTSAKKDFLYAGTIEATEVDLSSRLSSVIKKFAVAEGEEVRPGQLLAELDCDDLKLSADIAEKDFKRAGELYNSGSVSRENYDRLKYKRDDTALRLSWCSVKSPVNGKLLYKYREDGEMVAPGTKLLTVADLSEVWAYVYVPHDLLAKLNAGMEVKGFLPEAADKEFPGRVSVIYPEAEFTPKNVQTRKERTRLVFAVKVSFSNTEGTLKPGMTIEVELPD